MAFHATHGLENSYYWQRVCDVGNARLRELELEEVQVFLRPVKYTGQVPREQPLTVMSHGVAEFEVTVRPEQQELNIGEFVESALLDTIIAARHDGD